jgi:hypothetical protein
MGTHIGFDPHSQDRWIWVDPYATQVDLGTLFDAVSLGPSMAVAA